MNKKILTAVASTIALGFISSVPVLAAKVDVKNQFGIGSPEVTEGKAKLVTVGDQIRYVPFPAPNLGQKKSSSGVEFDLAVFKLPENDLKKLEKMKSGAQIYCYDRDGKFLKKTDVKKFISYQKKLKVAKDGQFHPEKLSAEKRAELREAFDSISKKLNYKK